MDTRLLHPWNFLGKSTEVGCHFLPQGIFLIPSRDWTQVSCIVDRRFTVWAAREVHNMIPGPLDSTTPHSTQPSRHVARGIPFVFLLGCLPNMPTSPQIASDQISLSVLQFGPSHSGGSPRDCSWNKCKEGEQGTCRALTTPRTPSFPFPGGGGSRPHPGVISLPL